MRTLWPQSKFDLPAHPRFKGFEAFAAREIFPRLAEMEGKRRRVVGRAKLIAVATGIVVAGALVLGYFDLIGMIALVALVIVTLLAGAFAAGWPLLSFASSVDEFLLAKTCAHLKLRHTGSEPNLPIERFLAARLLPPHDRFKLEDGIEAEGPDLAFTAAEATLTDSRTDSEGKSEEETVWRGLLLAVPAPHPFAGRTLVMGERAASEQFFDKQASERIELGLDKLGTGLEIRTTDSHEAHRILTPRVMRRLGELARQLGREPPSLGLIDDNVLLAIESDKDRFSGGSVFQPLERAANLGKLLCDLALVLEFAEALRDALGPGAPPRLTKPA